MFGKGRPGGGDSGVVGARRRKTWGMHKIACAADLLQVRTHTGLARHKKAERESQKRKKEAAIELS